MKFSRRLAILAWFSAGTLCLASCSDRHSQTSGPPAAADILLFAGEGTSRGDVAAVERILCEKRFSYSTANSLQLNSMSGAQLRAYRLLIVPGGNFEQIGKNLTTDAAANIRDAVHDGLNYLGLCAGAFFAGNSPYSGLNLTGGARFDFYTLEAQGVLTS